MCTRVVSTLAHVFEAAGIATVALVSIKAQAEAISPPRALYCEFPLGRPLGRPGNAAFQRSVLDAAFALLERSDLPVLETHPEVITDDVEHAVSCPLPPRHDPEVHPAVDEARGLRPAFDRAVAAAGGASQVGRVVGPDAIPDALAPFIAVGDGTPWHDVDFGGDPTTILMDLRSYYETAAIGLSDHVPAARSAETWYYQHTEAGRVVRSFFDAIQGADPPFPAMFYVIPQSQTSGPLW